MDIRVHPSVINNITALTGRRLASTQALSIIAGDADDIKGYLYDSPALPEIRGGSLHLYKLNETGIKTVLRRHGLKPPGHFLLFSAGGGFSAVVPAETATAVATDIEKLYPDRTGAATITTAIFNLIPFESSPPVPFGQIMEHMAHSLRRTKLDKAAVPFFPASPFARRCTSCSLRPAIHTVIREEEQLRLCEPCDLKRRAGAQRSPYRNKILRRLSHPGFSFPQTLAGIGKRSTRKGYIAVVAVDGNSIGNELFHLQHPEDYRAFSQGLTHATEEAVFGVLADVGKDFLARQEVPAEVIVTGGDDALFVVPCQYGLQAATKVCRRFAEETVATLHKRLTMSAGVVIAPENYPMYFLEQMATALLRSAKRLAREKKEGCVDFWFFRGSATMGTDPLAVRQRMLERSLDSRTHLLLHERPYTIDELDRLVDFAQRFVDADFPRSRLYGLRQALDVGRHHATLFFLYQLARSSKDQQELLRNFQAEFMAHPDSVVPWNQKREEGQVTYSTPLVDLIDACDLLGKEP